MRIDPKNLAVDYYFGDLQYWKFPRIAADALEEGYDGPALRRLAGLANPVSGDIQEDEIDAAFREMGVDAPITEDNARLALAIKSAHKALNGDSNVFDEATYVRIHLCQLSDSPDALKRIVNLSKEARNTPRSQWSRIEADLVDAFEEFLMCHKAQVPE